MSRGEAVNAAVQSTAFRLENRSAHALPPKRQKICWSLSLSLVSKKAERVLSISISSMHAARSVGLYHKKSFAHLSKGSSVRLKLFYMASPASFTPETAKAALTDILVALNCPENVQKITEAKENSGNEMLKMMQFVFPIVTQIQMDVIKNFGFPEGREGTVQFSQLIRTLERDDPEIAQLHGQVRAYFLPPVTISSSTEASL